MADSGILGSCVLVFVPVMVPFALAASRKARKGPFDMLHKLCRNDQPRTAGRLPETQCLGERERLKVPQKRLSLTCVGVVPG